MLIAGQKILLFLVEVQMLCKNDLYVKRLHTQQFKCESFLSYVISIVNIPFLQHNNLLINVYYINVTLIIYLCLNQLQEKRFKILTNTFYSHAFSVVHIGLFHYQD